MARTIYGNLTGMAARIERAENLSWLADEADKVRNPNSQYWMKKCGDAIAQVREHYNIESIWDSDLIPQKATYKRHYQLAAMLLQYKDVTPEYCFLTEKPA